MRKEAVVIYSKPFRYSTSETEKNHERHHQLGDPTDIRNWHIQIILQYYKYTNLASNSDQENPKATRRVDTEYRSDVSETPSSGTGGMTQISRYVISVIQNTISLLCTQNLFFNWLLQSLSDLGLP